jgi:hypothetical protein
VAVLTSRRRVRGRAARLALLLAAALAPLAIASCFNPAQPGCAFSCAGDGLCPSGYTCGGDLLCHRNDGQGVCAIQTDAARTDAAPTDAAPTDAAPTDAAPTDAAGQ